MYRQDVAKHQAIAITRIGYERRATTLPTPILQAREKIALEVSKYSMTNWHSSFVAFSSSVAGLVIRYSYLRASAHIRSREVENRPPAAIQATTPAAGEKMVTVLPMIFAAASARVHRWVGAFP